MRVRTLSAAFTTAALTAGAALLGFPAPAPAHAAGDVVEYRCTTEGVAGTQDVRVKVEMTMPAAATTGQQMTIGWHGTYADGTALRAPASGLTGASLYAYASISGLSRLTSATGVGTLGPVGAGQVIALPPGEVSLRTTSANAGTASVKPAALNVGDTPTHPLIRCEVLNAAALTAYPLTVTAAGPSSSPPATPTPSSSSGSPRPTRTVTATVTASVTASTADDGGVGTRPSGRGRDAVVTTPAGAAETGAGGDAGPDGRALVVTGLLITAASAAGLLLRRRTYAR
ncbi:hypothetical protein [Microbispora sp. ATCC PTA-5024]|uniref:hypothetical protein n=1 Tax=Microbispora sp. ATCC PTA-5024 TaxID=316330 RepID=UPI0003DC34B3|nr:hypothetical protein [Microbispora sp. ATCC PTA-5024]ETK38196.1 hypothetical protein MPTA5024_00065 [Microbispora sp. ATCC PTA-5024]